MFLTDGKNFAEITMKEWNGNGYSPDFSNDFFNAGALPYNDIVEAFVVDNIDYCICQAYDWQNGEGDFLDTGKNEDRMVFVNRMDKRNYA